MADVIPTYLLMGWKIEALSGGLVHCMLKIAHSTEHAEREGATLRHGGKGKPLSMIKVMHSLCRTLQPPFGAC